MPPPPLRFRLHCRQAVATTAVAFIFIVVVRQAPTESLQKLVPSQKERVFGRSFTVCLAFF
jgi:hypothetical protein